MPNSPLLHRRNSVADGLKAGPPQAPTLCETAPGGKRQSMANGPHSLFTEWLAEARLSEPNDANAMALATADAAGRPSARMELLKGHDERGFVFYTNLDSRKGGELASNPRAALLFHWQS